jgi:1-deoxy-D-xylulose-5-phosphate reductoisomerase
MALTTRNLAVLGSTGSIGTSTLDVVRAASGTLRPLALSAHSNLELLVQQAREFQPPYIVATDVEAAEAFAWPALPGIERMIGAEGLEHVVRDDAIDSVVAAIVGSAGLASTWAAVECGKRIALANKETLVVAGPLVCGLARKSGAELIPVDSEHSAIFQAIQAGRRDEIARDRLDGQRRALPRLCARSICLDHGGASVKASHLVDG